MATGAGTGTAAGAPAPTITTTQSAFGADVETVMADHFTLYAQQISYTPTGGSGVTIDALLTVEPEYKEETDSGEVAVQEARATIWLNATDGVASPARGAAVVYYARTWYVTQVLKDMNRGIAELLLRHEHAAEMTREGYRRTK